MKVAFFSTLFLNAILSISVVTAESLTLNPGSLLEELRTGTVTIKKDQLYTDQGEKVELKLMKQNEGEYGTKNWYYEVLEDNVHFCGDGSKADYLGVMDNEGSIVILAYQDRVNLETKKKYVTECGDYFYTH